VDDLAERVKEAAQLIQLCRKKLQKTRLEVEKVVAQMGLDADESQPGESLETMEESRAPDENEEAPF
jgi:exonuclease VII small subunit